MEIDREMYLLMEDKVGRGTLASLSFKTKETKERKDRDRNREREKSVYPVFRVKVVCAGA